MVILFFWPVILFSRLFLASIFLRWSSSSDLYFSASATMRSISSLDRRPLSLVMVILFFWPVLLSSAETLRMELASKNKITITNDKGRLSKDEIERMVAEAPHQADSQPRGASWAA